MKISLKNLPVLPLIFLSLLAIGCSSKTPEQFAKEMCDEMNRNGMFSVGQKAKKELSKHGEDWKQEYLNELRRRGCL